MICRGTPVSQVYLVDFGNEQYKEPWNLHVLLPQFCTLPRQGFRCILDPDSPGGAAKQDVLEKLVLGQTVTIVPMSKQENSDVFIVHLPEIDVNRSVLMHLSR